MICAYIRTGTDDDEISRQKHAIDVFALQRGWKIDDYILHNSLAKAEFPAGAEGVIIIADVAVLGDKLEDILSVLAKVFPDFALVEACGGTEWRCGFGEYDSVLFGMRLFLQLWKRFLSAKTRRRLSALKTQGKKLGAPGGKRRQSRLQRQRSDILRMYVSGISAAEIARKLKASKSGVRYVINNSQESWFLRKL